MSFVEETSVPPSLHDIVHGLIGTRAMASMMAERHPEKSDSLARFVESLKHAQEDFSEKVRPQRGNCP